MPHDINGIGTWYYGKRRIHRFKDTCKFCNRVGKRSSRNAPTVSLLASARLLLARWSHSRGSVGGDSVYAPYTIFPSLNAG
jgi:hypothetical protein